MAQQPIRLARRHVHLDFHTSPAIPDVGKDFDPVRFADTLVRAHVQAINLFAKCHHGYSYYPTDVGTMHPHLQRDLLGEQIAACRDRGLRTVAYTTVVWDELAASRHADWLQVDRDGHLVGRGPLDTGEEHGRRWRFLCMNSPYVDYLLAHTEEFCRRYTVDGVWFDIVWQDQPGCVCNYCLPDLQRRGLNPLHDEDLARHSRLIARAFMQRASALVRAIHPDATIFYNGRIVMADEEEPGNRPELGDVTHFEIESVPSGSWGYNHFPVVVRHLQTLDRPLLGMTTAFHKMWADFGTLKNAAALAYEVERVAAAGAAVCIGDQLHPRGGLLPATYDRIGAAFAALADIDPWLEGAIPQVDIGVLLPPGVAWSHGPLPASSEGAMRAFVETNWQFHLIDRLTDLTRYRVLVAPDDVWMDETLARRIDAYLERGGGLLLTGASGVRPDGRGFALDRFGVEDEGPSAYAPEYVRWLDVADGNGGPVAPLDHVLYERGRAVRAMLGAVVLAGVVHPYFNRTWEHFSSHFQTPPDTRLTRYAAVVVAPGGRVVYCAHPLFRAYRLHGYLAYRQIITACLRRLLPQPTVRFDGPTTAEVTVLRQEQQRRTVCELLHYVPQRRAAELDIIEDIVPLYGCMLSVRLERRPARAYLAPQGAALDVAWQEPYATVGVPEIVGRQLVVFDDGDV